MHSTLTLAANLIAILHFPWPRHSRIGLSENPEHLAVEAHIKRELKNNTRINPPHKHQRHRRDFTRGHPNYPTLMSLLNHPTKVTWTSIITILHMGWLRGTRRSIGFQRELNAKSTPPAFLKAIEPNMLGYFWTIDMLIKQTNYFANDFLYVLEKISTKKSTRILLSPKRIKLLVKERLQRWSKTQKQDVAVDTKAWKYATIITSTTSQIHFFHRHNWCRPQAFTASKTSGWFSGTRRERVVVKAMDMAMMAAMICTEPF